MSVNLESLFPLISARRPFTAAQAARVAACPNLVSIGALGEAVRKALRGDRVTFARVAVVPVEPAGEQPAGRGEASEVRIIGRPASFEGACAAIRSAKPLTGGVPLTGFSTADLLELAAGDHMVLSEQATVLSACGLAAVAETPIDRLAGADQARDAIRALRRGGLGVWRLTVDRPSTGERAGSVSAGLLDLIERAERLAADVGGIFAFAPLARHEVREAPSTGYDDVKTITLARLMCRSIPSIQVDWALHGPKLAQVAIAYGADDLDGISPYDDPAAGPRRAPRAEIERHIRAAYAVPAERTPTYELRS